jgi:hypothetical protein
MRAYARILCLALLSIAAHGQEIPGCILPAGYERAQPPRPSALRDAAPPGPRIRVQSLRRGFDDGRGRSCSNAGELQLVIDSRDVGPTDVYSFELVSGTLPERLLPQGYVEPVELSPGQHGFRFFWLDLVPGAPELETLDAVVRINRASFAGVRSEPMVLEIYDPGGTPASTSGRWNSPVVWVVIAIVALAVTALRMKAFRRPSRRRDELAEIQARLRELAEEKRRGS